MIFKTTNKTGVFRDVVEQVEQAILDGKFKPGDRLPAASDLQEFLDTSRGTLREALRVLEERGLIEIRPGAGGGAFVRPLGVEHISDSMALLIRHKRVALNDLMEFRLSVESTAAGLAAERANHQEIAAMQALLDEARHAAASDELDLDHFNEIERRLHMSLASLSKNPVFEWALMTMNRNLGPYDRLLARNPYHSSHRGVEEVLEDWQEIIEAMEGRQVTRVRYLIKSHVVRYNRHLMAEAKRLGLTEDKEETGSPHKMA